VETVQSGGNVLVGADAARILEHSMSPPRIPEAARPYGRGDASQQIVAILERMLEA